MHSPLLNRNCGLFTTHRFLTGSFSTFLNTHVLSTCSLLQAKSVSFKRLYIYVWRSSSKVSYFFLGNGTWKLLEETWLFFRLGEAKCNTVLPVECLWRGRVAVVFLILKWRRLHSKSSAWLSDSSTCVAWNQSKFIDNWVRHAVMALRTWKMCVRGCDISKKAERRVTWGVQVLRSPNVF